MVFPISLHKKFLLGEIITSPIYGNYHLISSISALFAPKYDKVINRHTSAYYIKLSACIFILFHRIVALTYFYIIPITFGYHNISRVVPFLSSKLSGFTR